VDGEYIFGEIEDNELTIISEQDWIGVDTLRLIVTEVADETNCDTTCLRIVVHPNNDVSLPPHADLPIEFCLVSAYPNPFNSHTNITYAIPEPCQVTLTVHDISGCKIATLVNTPQKAGRNTVIWTSKGSTGIPISSGIYLCRMQTGSFVETCKMTLIR